MTLRRWYIEETPALLYHPLATDTMPPLPRKRNWKLARAGEGYTATVASVGGGSGSFSVVRIVSRPIRRRSVGTIARKTLTMVPKKCQIGSFASITTKHRSDHRAAE